MNCLTQSEIEQWLSDHSVPALPYGKSKPPTHYLQFAVPSRPLTRPDDLSVIPLKGDLRDVG